ncbi:IS30 family transposase [Dietzia sp. IN118]|jgi:IS30 family transposase|uniref:IS30 family transposase n=1 Tax=Dietzia sp. IN118 TaxID=3061631 RepID=UPI00293AFB7F|nr:IS30 family transposase [Dietzia sp. IN118]MDV3356325.1 IS30 family transposase [Dietzia sp. IN118]
MAKIGRPGLPPEERQRVWDMWKAGSSISEISRSVDSPPGSVFSILRPKGGIYQSPQKRRAGTLSLSDREEISRGLAAGDSYRQIGRQLGRPASTICREVGQNEGRERYRAIDADDRAWRRARRPQKPKLATNPVLRGYVAARLKEEWSPEQIAGRLKKQYPAGSRMLISHEAIYRSLYIQSWNVLDKSLQKQLRTGRPIRRAVSNTTSGQWRSQIKDAVSIDARPDDVADRAVPGHWEGDLMIGSEQSQIATVVERSSRYTCLVQVDSRHASSVTEGLCRELSALPETMSRSLTWDRGMELAGHKDVAAGTGISVYFADPHSPWQRGTNENTNRWLRQYFPKKTSMNGYSQADLHRIAERLNNRPRKTLDYDTPAERYAALLH